jgi:hypothetical protein
MGECSERKAEKSRGKVLTCGGNSVLDVRPATVEVASVKRAALKAFMRIGVMSFL